MRSTLRAVMCGAALALAFFGARANTGFGVSVFAAGELAQFGGAVLVGDGEVFAGESANQFRPGTVYVYRVRAVDAAGSRSPTLRLRVRTRGGR